MTIKFLIVTFYNVFIYHRPLIKFIFRLKALFKILKSILKKKIKKYKERPKSKKKSFLVGFTAALNVFGVRLLTPALPAIAKDI